VVTGIPFAQLQHSEIALNETESLDDRVHPIIKSLLRFHKILGYGSSQFTQSVASSSQDFVTCDEELEELEMDLRNLLYCTYDYQCFFNDQADLNDREPTAFEHLKSVDGLLNSRAGLSTIVEDEHECSLGTVHLDFNSPTNLMPQRNNNIARAFQAFSMNNQNNLIMIEEGNPFE
jgi:hypothetical protein